MEKMELTDTQTKALQNRLSELQQARERLIEQANRELARLEGRIAELQQLLSPE